MNGAKFMIRIGMVVIAIGLARCENHHPPKIRVRAARPGESALVRRTSIHGTIDKRYPEDKQVSLYCPNGIPELTTEVASMRFTVITDDFERDVPPVASIVSATLDVRTNGHFLSEIQPTGVDGRHPEHARRVAAAWRK